MHVCVHASFIALGVRSQSQTETDELLTWQLLGLKQTNRQKNQEKQGWHGGRVLTFLWINAALRQYWIVWLMGFVRVVFKNEFAKNKLQTMYRRLHAYRVLVLSQTKSVLASVATKTIICQVSWCCNRSQCACSSTAEKNGKKMTIEMQTFGKKCQFWFFFFFWERNNESFLSYFTKVNMLFWE